MLPWHRFTTTSATGYTDRPSPEAVLPTNPIRWGAGARFKLFPKAITPDNDPIDKVRGKPEKFAEHYNQATLFFESQTPVEQAHIIGAFRFELSKVTVPAIRTRMVSSLINVSQDLAAAVAAGLGIALPKAMPRALQATPDAEIKVSPALSLMALPGAGSIATRKVAVLVADGVDTGSIASIQAALTKAGAVTRLLGVRLGRFKGTQGDGVEADATLENSPAVLFDGVIIPDGESAAQQLSGSGQAIEFLQNQYRHCKTIMVLGAGSKVLQEAGINATLPSGEPDPGVILGLPGKAGTERFVNALSQHRHMARDQDPPAI
jgi:catalase